MTTSTGQKRTRQAQSLSATLAIAFFTLSVVVLLLAGGSQLFFNIQTQQQALSNRQLLIAQDAAKTVSGFIQDKFSVLGTIVGASKLTSTDPEEQSRLLEGLLGLQPAFRHLVLLDTDNREITVASRLSKAASDEFMSRLDADLLAQIGQEQNAISPVYFDDVSSEPFVIMAVPVTDALGDFQGTLIAEVNLKFMWDLVDQLKVGETGYAYVVDDQGNLIAFRDTARVLRGENVASISEIGKFVADPSAVSAVTSEVQTYTGLTKTTIVGTYVPLGTPQWAVVTELPWQEAYGGIVRGTITSVSIILALAIMAGLGGVLVARRLAVPLVNLTETATRIAGGELDLKATAGGPSEIASLSAAFNSMSDSLQAMIDKETTSRVVLETTVDLYLAFVEQVAHGDLTPRLTLETYDDDSPAKSEPLYVLGINLNVMVNSLAEMTKRNAQLLAETQRAKEAAEEANRVKSQFLSSMSHELRTPLNAILNFNEMMSLGMVGPVTEQQVDVLNKALDSGRHLLDLINDVLDISKIQSGTLTLFVESGINLQPILENVASTAEVLFKNKPVRFIKDIDSDLPIISGDKRRIRQILLNLLSNAAKFTEEGSVTLTARRRDSEILFSVRDTGPGISEDQMGIIFEPFIQTETGIQHAGGTGLGLPISKSFVEAHGGKLWLESEPLKGTTFYFTLPIQAMTMAASPQN